MIRAKNLKEFSQNLNVLYVEDDLELLKSTTSLLENLFKEVDTAENGAIALEKYKNREYDLVISDINMPVLNGIDMIEQIKEINFNQVVIVTSAHDESEYLIKLIDLGVDSFILKPIELQKLLNILFKICRNLSDKKLLCEYREKLEDSNMELDDKNREFEAKNRELQKVNRLLELKLKQSCEKLENVKKRTSKVTNIDKSKINSDIGRVEIENYMEYILDSDIEEINDLESDIDSVSALISLNKKASLQNLKTLGLHLHKYGAILSSYPAFYNLGLHVSKFANEVEKLTEISDDVSQFVNMYLESFVFTLSKWRYELFEKGVTNPNIYDDSMINDINMLIDIITGSEDDKSGVIELF